MNWVQRKLRREDVLRNGGVILWRAVSTAVQDACNTFNESCRRAATLSNGTDGDANKIDIDVLVRGDYASRIPDRTIAINITYNPAEQLIKVVCSSPCKAQTFSIDADENEAWIAQGSAKIEADDISRKILEPVFFPER